MWYLLSSSAVCDSSCCLHLVLDVHCCQYLVLSVVLTVIVSRMPIPMSLLPRTQCCGHLALGVVLEVIMYRMRFPTSPISTATSHDMWSHICGYRNDIDSDIDRCRSEIESGIDRFRSTALDLNSLVKNVTNSTVEIKFTPLGPILPRF